MKNKFPRAVLAAQLGALLSMPAFAQQATPEGTRLKEVSVSATRTERNVDEVPATVTVIPGEEIERRMVRDIKDLIRYEPGVEVPSNTSGGGPGTFTNTPNRLGNSGFNIRGIEGNRVPILVDGIRVPDAFSFGSFSGPNRDLVDLDQLQRVEILRGPSSTLYGSDAIGGLVSYTTVDPGDLLGKRPGAKSYVFGRANYASGDESWGLNVGGAFDAGAAQLLFIVSGRNGHETGNKGGNSANGLTAFRERTEPNPMDYDNQSVLAKAMFSITPRDRVRLTAEMRTQSSDFNALNAVGLPVLPAGPAPRYHRSLDGKDSFEHTRLSADWEHRDESAKWLHGLRVSVYTLDSKTRQNTFVQYATVAANLMNRVRDLDFSFDQQTTGLQVQAETRKKWGSTSHRLTYGGEYFEQKTEELRDGTEYNRNAVTGVFVPAKCLAASATLGCSPFAGTVETYPLRDFPNSTTAQTGLYLQDEIQYGRLTVIPGLRYDRYDLKPSADSIYNSFTPGISPPPPAPVGLSFSSTTAKVGALYQLTDVHSLWGQFAQGFRAPPYNDVNINFANITQGYVAIANPDLKPEKSNGFELGWRANTKDADFGLTYFDNQFKDFIDTQFRLPCPGDPRCSTVVGTTFQSVNRAEVRIYGLEARGEWRFAREWALRGSFAWAHGDDESTGQPINTVAPPKLVAGLQWGDKKGPYGAEVMLTAAAKQSRIDTTQYVTGTPPATVAYPAFVPSAYQVFDLFGWWRPSKNVTVYAGLLNVFDKKYWRWNDVRLLNANAQNLDFFTATGRAVSASAKIEF